MTNGLPVVATSRNEEGLTEYNLIAASHWDDFDLLVEYLKKHWDATIMQSEDAVYSRTWILFIRGVRFSVCYDSHKGNFFQCEDPNESSGIAEAIANDLRRRLEE